MKKLMMLIGLIILCGALLTACKKNEQDKTYKDADRIGLAGDPVQLATADSTLFSFATYPKDTTGYNLHVLASIMGNVTSADRQFSIKVLPSSTALADEYTLPSTFTIKAGTVKTMVNIRVKRTARLANANAKLVLQIANNDNFQQAPHPTFSLVFTDQLTMPPNWVSAVQFYFGTYSKVKHSLLILSQPQFKDISALAGLYPQIFYVASAGLDSLTRYNAAHPGNPMKNENGLAIGICNGCN